MSDPTPAPAPRPAAPITPGPAAAAAGLPGRRRGRGKTKALVGLVLAAAVAATTAGVLVVRKGTAAAASRERAAVIECLDAVRRVRADFSPTADPAVVRRHLADAEAAVGRARAAKLTDAHRRQVDALEAARRGFAGVAAGAPLGPTDNPFETLAAVERDLHAGTAGD